MTLIVLLLWIYLFLQTLLFILQWLSVHWEILIILSQFPLTCHQTQRDAPFHRIACDYSCADWDGLRDHLRDVPWENIFKLGASAAASEFCEWVEAGIDICISLIVSIRSSVTHLHGFQLLVLLP